MTENMQAASKSASASLSNAPSSTDEEPFAGISG
jgi:hypothetical protein